MGGLARPWNYFRAMLRNGLVGTAVAILGVWGSALGIVSAAVGVFAPIVWIALIALTFVASAVVTRPKWHQRYSFPSGPWSIEIARDDLFDQDVPIVVTTDQAMSTDLAAVGPDSLVGQLIARLFHGDDQALSSLIAQYVPTIPAPGVVAPFTATGSQGGYLVTVATNDNHGIRTGWHDLATAHDALWEALRGRNVARIAAPVVGAGFARARLPYKALLLLLLLSFHSACLEGRVAQQLRIVIPADEFDPRVLRAVGVLLDGLGYVAETSSLSGSP